MTKYQNINENIYNFELRIGEAGPLNLWEAVSDPHPRATVSCPNRTVPLGLNPSKMTFFNGIDPRCQ